jgi:hypothetical protein
VICPGANRNAYVISRLCTHYEAARATNKETKTAKVVHYRVRYTAIEAVYHLRYRNQAALLEQAVRRRAGDEQAWVRGIVADCLAERILREGEQDDAERLQQFKPEVVKLLNDNDVWPL